MNTIRLSLILSLVAFLGTTTIAETLEERKIKAVQKKITPLQKRVDADRAKIQALDGQLEQGVTSIVKMVSAIRDSGKSGRAAVRLKEDVIKRLQSGIHYYEQVRKDLETNMNRYRVSEDDKTLSKALDSIEGRVDARIKDITDITASFSGFEPDGEYGDSTYSTTVDAQQGERIKKKLVADLRKEIDSLRKDNERLTRQKKDAEVKKNEEIIAKRQKQIDGILNTSPTNPTRVSSKGVKMRRKEVNERVKEIQKVFAELKPIVKRQCQNRVRLAKLEQELAKLQAPKTEQK